MILYVRQLAWLGAVPDPPKRKISDKPKKEEERKSRWDRIRDDDRTPELPEISAAGYLVQYLFDIGPTLAGGMGDAPLTHSEVRAFMENTGISLQPWEAQALRTLSRAYVAESSRATDPACPPPFGETAISSERRAAVAKKIDAFFG